MKGGGSGGEVSSVFDFDSTDGEGLKCHEAEGLLSACASAEKGGFLYSLSWSTSDEEMKGERVGPIAALLIIVGEGIAGGSEGSKLVISNRAKHGVLLVLSGKRKGGNKTNSSSRSERGR